MSSVSALRPSGVRPSILRFSRSNHSGELRHEAGEAVSIGPLAIENHRIEGLTPFLVLG